MFLQRKVLLSVLSSSQCQNDEDSQAAAADDDDDDYGDAYRPGVGNIDDGEGHYIVTFTPRGHCAYRVKNI